MFVDGEFWGLYLVGRVNTAETFARRAGGSPEEIQVIENRYPSQIAPEYGELYRLVTEGILPDTERIRRSWSRWIWKAIWIITVPISISVIRSLTLFPPLCGDGQEKERRDKWHWEFSDATDTLDGIRSVITSVNTYLCPGVAEDLFYRDC